MFVFEILSSKLQLVQLYCWYRALVLFANLNDVHFSLKINCCQSCSCHNIMQLTMKGFYGAHPGSLHITNLHGSLLLLEGSDPSWPSLILHTDLNWKSTAPVVCRSMLDLRHVFWECIVVVGKSMFSYKFFIDRHFARLIVKKCSLLVETVL